MFKSRVVTFKNHKKWILFFFFCSHSLIYAQEKQVLKGQIIADSLGGIQINITNITAKTGTISERDASFRLKAQIGDTLLFSSLRFSPYRLEVTDSVLRKNQVVIHLKKAVNMLREVTVNSSNLTGDLTKDVTSLEYFDQAKIGFPIKGKKMSVEEKRLYYIATDGAIGSLINLLSGRKAMLERQLKYAQTESKKKKAIHLVSLQFFTDELDIPKNSIDNFLYYCLDFDDFPNPTDPKKALKLITFFQEKAEIYKELKQEK